MYPSDFPTCYSDDDSSDILSSDGSEDLRIGDLSEAMKGRHKNTTAYMSIHITSWYTFIDNCGGSELTDPMEGILLAPHCSIEDHVYLLTRYQYQ